MSEATITLLLVAGGLAVVAAIIRRGPAGGDEGLGSRVLVAVSRPASAVPLSHLAVAVARASRGRITPFTVLTTDASRGTRERAEETTRRCSSVVIEHGLNADGQVRYDASVADGLFHGAVEHDASSVVLGMPRGESTTAAAAELEQLVSALPVPVLVARLDGYQWERVVLRVPPEPNSEGLRASLRLATTVAERLAATTGVQVVCTSRATVLDGSPAQLVIVPVDPEPAAIRRAVALSGFSGDTVLALCHGAGATERRPLLPSAAALYDPKPEPVAEDAPRSLVPSQER